MNIKFVSSLFCFLIMLYIKSGCSLRIVRPALRSLRMQSHYRLLQDVIVAEGVVCKGYGRGSKKLGFPTANLPQFDKELAANSINRGIYFGWCRIGDERTVYPCVTNIGISPTFVGQENPVNIIESYVLDRLIENGDFYGHLFRLALVGYIRPEQKFSGLPALIAQIQSDVDVTEEACRTLRSSPNGIWKASDGINSINAAKTSEASGSITYENFVLPILTANQQELVTILQSPPALDVAGGRSSSAHMKSMQPSKVCAEEWVGADGQVSRKLFATVHISGVGQSSKQSNRQGIEVH